MFRIYDFRFTILDLRFMVFDFLDNYWDCDIGFMIFPITIEIMIFNLTYSNWGYDLIWNQIARTAFPFSISSLKSLMVLLLSTLKRPSRSAPYSL